MRITRHQVFMDMAEVLARRSTCYRANVAALVVRNNDILSCGYNGAPAGEGHCEGNTCPLYPETGGCMKAEHAEKNALIRAMGKIRMGNLDGCILYCTSSPCVDCASRIALSHVGCLIYRNTYRDDRGLKLLMEKQRPLIYRLTPSGYLINERTGALEDA